MARAIAVVVLFEGGFSACGSKLVVCKLLAAAMDRVVHVVGLGLSDKLSLV